MASTPAPRPAADDPELASSSTPLFRSAAVARRAGMPVATLRIWEQRHRAVRPATSPSGHRLYSSADVERVVLLRRLTAQGHAIGAIAGLDSGQLRRLLATRPDDGASAAPMPSAAARPLRLVVVGRALADRLARPAVTRRLAVPPDRLAVFDSAEVAATAVPTGEGIDLLVCQLPGLPAQVPAELVAAAEVWRARRVAVVHRFAGSDARHAFEQAGVQLLREPADDETLGVWLAACAPVAQARARSADARAFDDPTPAPIGDVPPRRFDDATLTAVAALPTTVACECPRHVAELLMQLAAFESYSAGCASRGPRDAALHEHLRRVSGTARAMFEDALVRVARHEGLDGIA
ncbi:MAG: MerR family transcriptional regulator [Burkholderiales bacterium]|jgi:DNA-binding transcriptional MerR regulator